MTYDTTPKPAFLRAMQAQTWKVSGALAELVDNSFGPARGDANHCTIVHEPAKHLLAILDNGRGMNPGVGRLFQLGNAIGRAPGDIGMYGSGGTLAIIWLAERVKVWTLRDGHVNADSVKWADYFDGDVFPMVSDVWEKANQNNTPAPLLAAHHGTLIELQLRRERSFYTSNVIRDLSETYAPAKRLGRKLTWTTVGKNGLTQTLSDPFEVLDPENSVVIDGGLMVGDEYLEIRGEIGLVEGLSRQKSTVAIGYGPRVIFRTRDCFRSPDPSETFQAAGVAGFLDLRDGWQPYLTLTKDEIADGPVRTALMTWLFEKVRPLLRVAEESGLQVLLDGIAINLQARYEAGERHLGTGVGPKPGEGHSVIEINPQTGEVVHGKVKTQTRGSMFEITPLDDVAMDGRLCLTERQDDQILVFVNKDHPVVIEALKAQPINRMALELLVTREIADLLEKDDELRKKTFRPLDREVIEEKGAGGATIHRILMDRVRRPEKVS